MFGRKKEGEPLKGKAKIENYIENLAAGYSLRYRLGEIYYGGNAVVSVELNPSYGEKNGDEGRKYKVTIEQDGKSSPFGYFNKASDIAGFITDRRGEIITSS